MITRRDFVERAAVLAAGAGALPRLLGRLGRSDPAGDGGAARCQVQGDELALANAAVAAVWSVAGGALRAVRFEDRVNGARLTLPPDAFSLALPEGGAIRSSEMRVTGPPRVERLAADPAASRLVERVGGQQVSVTLADPAGRLRVSWRGILRDGSAYVRQEIRLESTGGEVPLRRITLVDLDLPGASLDGAVSGSPVVTANLYVGFEHPLSESAVDGARVTCGLKRELPLRPGTAPAYSSVIGATRPGQFRRDFLAYLERERAHPYRPFLHYNSWYDIGYFSPFDQAAALAVVDAFGTELKARRGVTLDSFLFDDGWDDHATLWHFNAGFPAGFTPVRAAAAKYGSAPGVWMSPWGGYGRPREERLRYGREQGFETNEGGFALSGPRYYARFRDVCLEMIRTYGVNQFKIDGTGNVSRAIPGSAFDSDFDAAIHLIEELRAVKPDLFVNLTTGTFPSPFWLRYADSIWRGGEDHDFAGVGTDRQRWITYRDGDTYHGIVAQGPLFPLNSLMLHGLIFARHAHNLNTDPHDDFGDEIRAYFGTGTQLQEMYVTPSLLTAQNWDVLAESARWARVNADVLVDTHWIGGDPLALETYGHAAWRPGLGIVVLRNPKDAPQSLTLDVRQAFELPDGAPRVYAARSPWAADRGQMPLRLEAGVPHRFELRPFQVLTLEAQPVG
ncbi:MAG: enterotoxin [Candidatus Rokuibacteriota bacterium]